MTLNMRHTFSGTLAKVAPTLTDEQRSLCTQDLYEMFREDYDGDDDTQDMFVNRENAESCWREWLRRLGGAANIKSYAEVLQAGAARKAR